MNRKDMLTMAAQLAAILGFLWMAMFFVLDDRYADRTTQDAHSAQLKADVDYLWAEYIPAEEERITPIIEAAVAKYAAHRETELREEFDRRAEAMLDELREDIRRLFEYEIEDRERDAGG